MASCCPCSSSVNRCKWVLLCLHLAEVPAPCRAALSISHSRFALPRGICTLVGSKQTLMSPVIWSETILWAGEGGVEQF